MDEVLVQVMSTVDQDTIEAVETKGKIGIVSSCVSRNIKNSLYAGLDYGLGKNIERKVKKILKMKSTRRIC